jgi:hypothetical protein
MIRNEFIKSTPDMFLALYVDLFNLIFNSGKIPNTWLAGNIVPFYKNKGAKTDPKNFRPITILSCFGKLFTSVLNNRLAFSKSINAQKSFFFFNFSSSKRPYITKVLSRVEYFFLKPVWFSFKRRNSSEKVFNLLFNTDVNNFPKQLKMVIGRKFLGSVFAPLFL